LFKIADYFYESWKIKKRRPKYWGRNVHSTILMLNKN